MTMRVHDSQVYRKMDMTREHISHILELREILLSIQTGFSLVNAAVVCAILKCISGLEPSSVITEPRYLKLVNVTKLLSIHFDLVLMPLVLFVISLTKKKRVISNITKTKRGTIVIFCRINGTYVPVTKQLLSSG